MSSSPRLRPFRRLLLALGLAAATLGPGQIATAQTADRGVLRGDTVPAAQPTDALAADLFGVPEEGLALARVEQPPAWRASAGGQPLGLVGSTWELAESLGYSGRPLDVLVAVTPAGVIAGARLMRHNEPVLTLGISDADIATYVDGFAGFDMRQAAAGGNTLAHSDALPDVISRATVTTGVIRDAILRTARILTLAQGVGGGGPVDRVGYAPADWAALVQMGALGHATATMAEAAEAFAASRRPVTPSDRQFLDLWAGVIDPPTIGRNLLGPARFAEAAAALAPDQALLLVATNGLTGHRGTEWRRSGRFERVTVSQAGRSFTPTAEGSARIAGLEAEGAPSFREISLFPIPADPEAGGFDLTQPLDVTVTSTREAADGTEIAFPVTVTTAIPAQFIQAPPAPETPLWVEFWQVKKPQIAVVGAMLLVLALILFGQEWLVRRTRLYPWVRLGYLSVTLVVLGWGLGAQLSVVQVVAFLHALLSGFRWETFLVAPLIFILWSAVALGMLFWGRGVFCGWLCPFGALQELVNAAAVRLGVKQIAVPQALHERLWVIKYSLFVAIVALSFYSMQHALILAEVEPFKTAISMRFLRPWPFVAYALALLTASLFIERFFCRYVCPLGAGLAIPAKLKIFDWLKRRPQCGRECRLCETRCPVGAIDALGRINANECHLCLRCQVIMDDPNTCPVLKRRARGAPTGGQHPSGAHAAPVPPLVPPPVTPGPTVTARSAQPPAFRSTQVHP
ncbi:4Fe-4S binding protein [Paracoccus sp. S-4012]|uniref:NosR/NirI family protein n=1 Tax=Paracoccus sp. S-4012 TaxID=2665648 RepID=UPI0012B138C0|nr:NosR/NirI family protein [Paracoccus sp. S-4012]MRX50480.1 4Fe-4S binding protein [Paracoccus sp. S-4012]